MEDTYKFEVTLELEKSSELLSDILDLFIDAIGCNYSTFEFVYQSVDGPITTNVEVTDPEDDNKRYNATHETVFKGLTLMLADDGKPKPGAGSTAQSYVPSIDSTHPSPARRVAIGLITGEYDAGTIDAGDADCIVQLGLLGEVRYG